MVYMDAANSLKWEAFSVSHASGTSPEPDGTNYVTQKELWKIWLTIHNISILYQINILHFSCAPKNPSRQTSKCFCSRKHSKSWYKEKKILLFVVLAYTYMFTEAGLVSFSLNFVFFEITKHHWCNSEVSLQKDKIVLLCKFNLLQVM